MTEKSRQQTTDTPLSPLLKEGMGVCNLPEYAVSKILPTAYCLLPTICSQKGFALVSVVIILSLMGIAASVATHFMHRLTTVRRELATVEELKSLKEAMIGNPRRLTKEGRNNFGYLGDMGRLPNSTLEDLYTQGDQPNYTLDATARMGAGWAGPYVTTVLNEDLSDFLTDAFGNQYEYTSDGTTATILSYGPDKTKGTADDRQIQVLSSETLATVSGYVKDSEGTAISGATVRLYYPYEGSVTYVDTTTNAQGLFTFTNVPQGIRSLAVTAPASGSLKYAEDSALATGTNCNTKTCDKCNDLSFNITNWGASPVIVNSIKLDYTTSPQSFYEQVYVGGTKVFDYNDAGGNRGKSGDTITFSNVSIAEGSSVSSVIKVLAASDNVQLSDIVLSPKGGGTLNIRYLHFKDKQTDQVEGKGKGKGKGGASAVSLCNVTFTVTFYYNGTPVFIGPTPGNPESFVATLPPGS